MSNKYVQKHKVQNISDYVSLTKKRGKFLGKMSEAKISQLKTVDRRNSLSEKWSLDNLRRHFGTEDVIPLWLADMDFETPEAIQNSIKTCLLQKTYGIEYRQRNLFQVLKNWYMEEYNSNLDINKMHFVINPMFALSLAIQSFTKEGDFVVIQPPCSYFFRNTIKSNGRMVLKNALEFIQGKWGMNFRELKKLLEDEQTTMMILSNPHGPLGRNWQPQELGIVVELCRKYNVTLLVDEMYADLSFHRKLHHPIQQFADRGDKIISSHSPAVTFNIVGLSECVLHTADSEMTFKLQHELQKLNLQEFPVNPFSAHAFETAYSCCKEWNYELIKQLHYNFQLVLTGLSSCKSIVVTRSTASHFIWLDFRNTGLSQKELDRTLIRQIKVAMDPGFWYGSEGSGFMAMNIGCSAVLLSEAIKRITDYFGTGINS